MKKHKHFLEDKVVKLALNLLAEAGYTPNEIKEEFERYLIYLASIIRDKKEY